MKRLLPLFALTLIPLSLLFSRDHSGLSPAGRPPFAGEFRYWSESPDFESVRIHLPGDDYIVWIRGGGRMLRLVCALKGDEIVSEPRDEIAYIFRMNGENELRLRKLYLNKDRPEDMEWVFFRNDLPPG
jgi:hypothetical protein